MIITIRLNCYSYSLVDEHLTRNGIWTELPLVPVMYNLIATQLKVLLFLMLEGGRSFFGSRSGSFFSR